MASWNDLTTKYHGWRAPTVSVQVGGEPVLDREWRLLSLQCRISVEMEASTCVISLGNVYDEVNSKFACEDLFVLGAPVTVALGYVRTMPVFTGYLYEVSYELGENAQVTLNCMDVKGAMMENSFITGEGTYREAIRSMFQGTSARGYTVLCGQPDMKDLPELDQPISFDSEKLDDFGFLQKTAELWGLECFVRGGELLLRKKPPADKALLAFSPGTFHSLSVGFSSVAHVHSVRVRGGTDDVRDQEKKRVSAVAVNPRDVAPPGTKAARLLRREAEFYMPNARDEKTAQEMADAEMRRREKHGGDVNLSLRGLPDLLPGEYVDFTGISPKINGRYYLAEVTHQFTESAFTTSAVCRRG